MILFLFPLIFFVSCCVTDRVMVLFTSWQPPPMTEEEKRERREAALKAAEARTKDWDKRLNKGRQASSKKETANGVSCSSGYPAFVAWPYFFFSPFDEIKCG